jgi:NAD(P)-dependent dehydrogenase (short-subunit alcohol dehydrogenase family)
MAGPLASKVVIVTGGASGIGRAVAGRIIADGGAVVIAGRRRDAGKRAAEQLRAGGGRALFVAADVTVERDAERLVAAAVTEFGRLDGAVNNAGGVSAAGPVHTVGSGAWHAELEQNLTSVFYCLKFQIPAMTGSADGGSIINNASTGGVRGIPGLAAYAAAKHGVVGLTRSAALECAGRGVGSTRWSLATSTRRCTGTCWARRPRASCRARRRTPPAGWPRRARSRPLPPSSSATSPPS